MKCLIYTRCLWVLGEADRVLVADRALSDLVLGDADRVLPRDNGVYLQKFGGILQLGDRRVALHLQVRTNSLANGFG